MNLLLISNSTNAGEEYLAYAIPYIKEFVKDKPNKALFIPYAGVTLSWDDYYKKVSEKLALANIETSAIHHTENPTEAIEQTELIVVGGGNTFNLLKNIQENKLVSTIRRKVFSGTPYIGWSAGSNLTCPSIRTTNDMPIVEPESFDALNIIPFQINPHYTDANIQQHAGETREMRIEEFIAANPDIYVAGLREGSMFKIEGEDIQLWGEKPCRIFFNGTLPQEMEKDGDFSFLMQ